MSTGMHAHIEILTTYVYTDTIDRQRMLYGLQTRMLDARCYSYYLWYVEYLGTPIY